MKLVKRMWQMYRIKGRQIAPENHRFVCGVPIRVHRDVNACPSFENDAKAWQLPHHGGGWLFDDVLYAPANGQADAKTHVANDDVSQAYRFPFLVSMGATPGAFVY